jgi:ABC-type uncharacterized transport system auxiliary subunit
MNWGFLVQVLPLLLAFCLLAGATGCLRLLRAAPDKHFYVLDTTRPATPASATPAPAAGANTRVLTVRRFRVSPPYDMTSLVFRRGEDRYEADFYNEFFMTPANMYTERAARWFEASGLFDRVVDSAGTLPATHVLEGAVTRACGDFSKPSTPLAVLDAQFLLLDVTRAEPRVVAQKNEHVEVPLARATAQDVVAGLTDALRQALEGFEADAREALSKPPVPEAKAEPAK